MNHPATKEQDMCLHSLRKQKVKLLDNSAITHASPGWGCQHQATCRVGQRSRVWTDSRMAWTLLTLHCAQLYRHLAVH